MKYLAEHLTAEMLGIKVSTLRKWRFFGDRGPRWVKFGPGRKAAVRYAEADLRAWLASLPSGGAPHFAE
jgi:hypothetical protein